MDSELADFVFIDSPDQNVVHELNKPPQHEKELYNHPDLIANEMPSPAEEGFIVNDVRVTECSLDPLADLTMYRIDVRTNHDCWHLSRKFDDFCALNKFFEKEFPNSVLPKFPGKSSGLLKGRSQKAESRKEKLDAFLSSTFQSNDLKSAFEVLNFCQIDTHIARAFPIFTEAVEGSIYLKIIEFDSAETLSKSFCRFYQVVPIMAKKVLSTLDTEIYKGGTQKPAFHQESLFYVQDRKYPLRISLCESKFSSDNIFAHVQVDLRPLQPYILYDLWLNMAGGRQTKAHIAVQFLPMKIPKPLAQKIPKFRLSVEKEIYYPSELIRGTLTLNVGKPKTCRKVYVRLYGYTRTYWTEERTNSEGKTERDTYTETRCVIHQKLVCYIQHPDSKYIDSGTFIWPFEFLLPARLPPTFMQKLGGCQMEVTYCLKATFDKPGTFEINKRIQCPLIIKTPFTALSPLPSMFGQFKKLPFSNSGQTVSISGSLGYPICVLETTQTINLFIDNQTSKEIQKGKVSLKLNTVAHAHKRRKKNSWRAVSIDIPQGFPIPPRESRSIVVHFPIGIIPPTLPPDLSPLIETEYHFSIHCPISGIFSGAAKAKIPVLVSQPIPQSFYTPPLVHPVEQPSEKISDHIYGTGGLPRVHQFTPVPEQPVDEKEDKQFATPYIQLPIPPRSAFSESDPFAPSAPVFHFPAFEGNSDFAGQPPPQYVQQLQYVQQPPQYVQQPPQYSQPPPQQYSHQAPQELPPQFAEQLPTDYGRQYSQLPPQQYSHQAPQELPPQFAEQLPTDYVPQPTQYNNTQPPLYGEESTQYGQEPLFIKKK